MNLKGKRIAFLGDSITERYCASSVENCFVERIKRDKELAEAYNYGIGGTRIAKQLSPSEDTAWDRDFISRVDSMEQDVDAVVVFGGTNDFGHGDAPFGELGDVSEDTFCGACYVLMKKLVEKYPTVPIVIVTPLHRHNENELINKYGLPRKPLCEYVNIIRKTAEVFSLPVADLFAYSGMQPCVKAQYEAYFVDGLHPNDLGHAKIAEILSNFIERFV